MIFIEISCVSPVLFMNDNVEEPTKSTDDYNRHGHSSSSSPDINSLSFRSSYININIDKRPINIHFVNNFVDIEPNLNDNFRHVIICDRTNEIDYGDGYGIREAKMIDIEKKIIYIKDEDFNGDNFYDMIVHWRFIPQLSDTELSNFNSRMFPSIEDKIYSSKEHKVFFIWFVAVALAVKKFF